METELLPIVKSVKSVKVPFSLNVVTLIERSVTLLILPVLLKVVIPVKL